MFLFFPTRRWDSVSTLISPSRRMIVSGVRVLLPAFEIASLILYFLADISLKPQTTSPESDASSNFWPLLKSAFFSCLICFFSTIDLYSQEFLSISGVGSSTFFFLPSEEDSLVLETGAEDIASSTAVFACWAARSRIRFRK